MVALTLHGSKEYHVTPIRVAALRLRLRRRLRRPLELAAKKLRKLERYALTISPKHSVPNLDLELGLKGNNASPATNVPVVVLRAATASSRPPRSATTEETMVGLPAAVQSSVPLSKRVHPAALTVATRINAMRMVPAYQRLSAKAMDVAMSMKSVSMATVFLDLSVATALSRATRSATTATTATPTTA